jgi:hypothetical protein
MYKVVKIIDEYKVVINAGSRQDICEGQKYLIFSIDNDEIFDPDTGESLGYLEIVKGTGIVTHVQEKIATLESATYRRKKNVPPFYISDILSSSTEDNDREQRRLPFKDLVVGDYVKQIN